MAIGPFEPNRVTYDEDIYMESNLSGTVIRKVPKKPSKYALRKNTKRARKFAAVKGKV